MGGTYKGGLKAAETNYRRHGEDFYRKIGALGGKKSRGGGFAANRKLASIAGKKGGTKSRRGKSIDTYKLSTKDLEEI